MFNFNFEKIKMKGFAAVLLIVLLLSTATASATTIKTIPEQIINPAAESISETWSNSDVNALSEQVKLYRGNNVQGAELAAQDGNTWVSTWATIIAAENAAKALNDGYGTATAATAAQSAVAAYRTTLVQSYLGAYGEMLNQITSIIPGNYFLGTPATITDSIDLSTVDSLMQGVYPVTVNYNASSGLFENTITITDTSYFVHPVLEMSDTIDLSYVNTTWLTGLYGIALPLDTYNNDFEAEFNITDPTYFVDPLNTSYADLYIVMSSPDATSYTISYTINYLGVDYYGTVTVPVNSPYVSKTPSATLHIVLDNTSVITATLSLNGENYTEYVVDASYSVDYTVVTSFTVTGYAYPSSYSAVSAIEIDDSANTPVFTYNIASVENNAAALAGKATVDCNTIAAEVGTDYNVYMTYYIDPDELINVIKQLSDQDKANAFAALLGAMYTPLGEHITLNLDAEKRLDDAVIVFNTPTTPPQTFLVGSTYSLPADSFIYGFDGSNFVRVEEGTHTITIIACSDSNGNPSDSLTLAEALDATNVTKLLEDVHNLFVDVQYIIPAPVAAEPVETPSDIQGSPVNFDLWYVFLGGGYTIAIVLALIGLFAVAYLLDNKKHKKH
ncbi:hypothetical protein Arcve_0025 [Archaeoglobus veneficus SNP6]|uniref:Uncharacterized protein n=3 Tax=root TaxID=1 RepID=F2KMP5_ARCVS|nr:hypothetical protein Arcve_0025 [Archaeoglobus veneficus SNP6]